MNAFGARPPPGAAWHTGKTTASIRFVQDAEEALTMKNDMSDVERRLLEVRIQMLKNGTMTLDDTETVDEWLEQLRMHHP